MCIKQITDETHPERKNTGDKVYVWDYTHESPQISSDLPMTRFGGTSVIISNRYLPECRSKYIV